MNKKIFALSIIIVILLGLLTFKMFGNSSEEEIIDDSYVEEEKIIDEDINDEYEALLIAESLYEIGLNIISCESFEYNQKTKEVYNYEELKQYFSNDHKINYASTATEQVVTIDNYVKLEDGKYYLVCDLNRKIGENYSYTDLVYVSSSNDEIKVNANAYYCDYSLEMTDTGCATNSVTYDLVLRKEENEWKIAEITMPY